MLFQNLETIVLVQGRSGLHVCVFYVKLNGKKCDLFSTMSTVQIACMTLNVVQIVLDNCCLHCE